MMVGIRDLIRDFRKSVHAGKVGIWLFQVC